MEKRGAGARIPFRWHSTVVWVHADAHLCHVEETMQCLVELGCQHAVLYSGCDKGNLHEEVLPWYWSLPDIAAENLTGSTVL
jgi:hypothetical protein